MTPRALAGELHLLTSRLDAAAEQVLQAEFGISHSQLAFLVPLVEAGELDVTSLAGATGVSVPAVSKRVAWFADRDLVRSRHAPDGGRRVLLSATPRGRRLARRAAARLQTRLDELLGTWSDERLRLLHDLVADLSRTIAESTESARTPA